MSSSLWVFWKLGCCFCLRRFVGDPPVSGLSEPNVDFSLPPLLVKDAERVRRAQFASVALSLVAYEMVSFSSPFFSRLIFSLLHRPFFRSMCRIIAFLPALYLSLPVRKMYFFLTLPLIYNMCQKRPQTPSIAQFSFDDDDLEEELLFEPTGVAISPSRPREELMEIDDDHVSGNGGQNNLRTSQDSSKFYMVSSPPSSLTVFSKQ